jgi:hypothetical protein
MPRRWEIASVRPLVAFLALSIAWFLCGTVAAFAGGRVALVMVAEDYQKLQKSTIGAKRANDIAESLTAKGFEVIVSTNPSNSGARANLRDFSAKTLGADLAIAVLAGHGTAAGGQSFFLPVNAEISAATDLFSRGIAVTSVAQIVGRAKAGGVIVLMTAPTFPAPVDGLDARPEFTAEIAKNVVTVFSSSAKVPVSRVDVTSEEAADAVAGILRQPAPSLRDLVKAASKDVGSIFGAAADISLAKPVAPTVTEQTAGVQPDTAADAQKAAETQAKLDSERQAREQAEKRALEDQAKAEAAQNEARKAQADVVRAQAEAKKAQADAERARADADKAKAEARQVEAQAELARAQAEAARTAAAARAASVDATPPLDEKLLGQRQRQRIQERLRDMGLYTGAIDSIMGPLTREAIMGFQRSRGAAVTGFLTPDQYQTLVPEGN